MARLVVERHGWRDGEGGGPVGEGRVVGVLRRQVAECRLFQLLLGLLHAHGIVLGERVAGGVLDVEDVERVAFGRGEDLGADDIATDIGETARQVGKQAGPVMGRDGEGRRVALVVDARARGGFGIEGRPDERRMGLDIVG